MAVETAMKPAVKHVAKALRKYAAEQGWKPDAVRLFGDTDENWGFIHMILAANEITKENENGHWNAIQDFLEQEFSDDWLKGALRLNLKGTDELEALGSRAIPRVYEELEY